MFPLVAIGGVIGAIVSVAKGASWLSDQLGSTKGTGSVGGKTEVKPGSDAKASSFQAALAAQAAGQSVPPSASTAPTTLPAAASSAMLPAQQHGPDYDAIARMKAGIFAYSHVGEHRDGHDKATQPSSGADGSVGRS
jgi:hypothetical protein